MARWRDIGCCLAAGGMLAGVSGGASGQPASMPSGPRIHLADSTANGAVRRAVLGASFRLARPGCRRILTDFADESGRSLLSNLEASSVTASEYVVERIWFVDGSEAPQCLHDARTAAFTAAGEKVVRICASAFVRRFATETATAEILVIHELLHTLGLGENPPSSPEITQWVMRRCGGS